MSMNLNDGIAQVIATGGELSIPWDFKISDRSELRIVRTRGTSDEVLVLNSTYTIADNQLNQDLGGIAVLAGSATPAVAGDIYTLLLDTQFARGTSFGSSDFNQAGDLFADVLNNQFDNIVRMCQRLGRDVAKSLKFDETLDIPVATITAAPVDGELLAFQGTGGNVVGVTLGGIANLSTTFTTLTAGDSLDFNGTNWVNRRHLSSLGTNIASASTTALGAADSDLVTITGTTGIVSFGTPSTFSRKHVWAVFSGVVTITHNATSLILPGAANYTTAAGDVLECVHISGANWRVVGITKANGQAVTSGAAGLVSNTGYKSGRYYTSLGYYSSTDGSIASGNLICTPFMVPTSVTLTAIGVNVTTVGVNARLGIYNFVNGLPTTLVLDAGTVSVATSGEKEIAISQLLPAGMYALGIIFSATTSVSIVDADCSGVTNYFIGSSNGLMGSTTCGVAMSTSFGALPATFTFSSYTSSTGTPVIYVRS